LRDGDFLTVCCEALRPEADRFSEPYSDLYEGLAKGELSKLEALDLALKTLGLDPLKAPQNSQLHYDIDTLMAYAPDNDQRFVSLMIDFVAGRSPTAEEAVQFEYLLRSSKSDRIGLLEMLVNRYGDHFSIEDGNVITLPPAKDDLTVCQTRRGRMYLHEDIVLNAEARDTDALLRSTGGELLRCSITLPEPGDWELVFQIDQEGAQMLAIEVRGVDRGTYICSAKSSQNLHGSLKFQTLARMREVEITLSCVNRPAELPATFAPILIKMNPRSHDG